MRNMSRAEEIIELLKILKEQSCDCKANTLIWNVSCNNFNYVMDECIHLLEQEPRKGQWIPYLKEGLIVKCSECKSRYTLGYNFCPNCGADMREVENGNDD